MSDAEDCIHYFVDEAGDTTLFRKRRKVSLGSEGCSNYFILGKLDVADPEGLGRELEGLRASLLSDPYFKGVPSMNASQRKTARTFHAKDDVAEVRREVFMLLQRHDLRFYGVVRSKRDLLAFVQQRYERESGYEYRQDEVYDSLVSELFRKFHGTAARINICFAQRGEKNRQKALEAALASAQQEFQRSFGFLNPSKVAISSAMPPGNPGLQAVDYFLWALQRFYERREDRYLEMMWPQIGEVHDLDVVSEGKRGVIFFKGRPLTLEARPDK